MKATEVSLVEFSASVKALWQRNLDGVNEERASEKLQVGYLVNPAGTGKGVLLFASDRNEPVGVICLHSRRLHLGAIIFRAANLADYAVDSTHRTLGPALMLMKQALSLGQQHLDLLYGLPNPSSTAVCVRAGLSRLGDVRRHRRILSGRHPRVQAFPIPLSRIIGSGVSGCLKAWDAVRSLWLGPRLRCHDASLGDAVVDEVWAARPRDMLLSERSADMLRWRYARSHGGRWQLCAVRDLHGDAFGYVVWRDCRGLAFISDFFSIDPRRTTAALLNAFCRYARLRGVHTVTLEFFGADEVQEALARVGFRRRDAILPVVMRSFRADDPEARDAQLCYVTPFDNDSD
jgi:hypothetical protein